MGASIIAPNNSATYAIGGTNAVQQKTERNIRLAGRDDRILGEGDGAFIEKVSAGDELLIESVGEGEAEVIVLDSN